MSKICSSVQSIVTVCLIYPCLQNIVLYTYHCADELNTFISLTHVDIESPWLLQDTTFEKMGPLMAENGGRLLGIYDELSTFLTKIKLYSSCGLMDSHELAMFLEMYNALQ